MLKLNNNPVVFSVLLYQYGLSGSNVPEISEGKSPGKGDQMRENGLLIPNLITTLHDQDMDMDVTWSCGNLQNMVKADQFENEDLYMLKPSCNDAHGDFWDVVYFLLKMKNEDSTVYTASPCTVYLFKVF